MRLEEKKLTEFTFVLSVHVIQEIFAKTGPVSRQLHAADCDSSQATTVVRTGLMKLCTMREADDVKWLELRERTSSFCAKYDMPTGRLAERTRKKNDWMARQ